MRLFWHIATKMAGYNDKEIDDFISKVDEVGSLIKRLTSGDSELEAQAANEADKIIGKEQRPKSTSLGFDKTQINKYEDNSKSKSSSTEEKSSPLQFNEESVSPEDFMKRVELDAAERRDRKQRNNELANELKEKGNKAFKRKDFEEAIRYYDEAISVVKDNTILYTNRAQALIHVGKNDQALEDCLLAQKIDSKCAKAIIHQGRALQNLARFEEAIKCFERVKSIDNKKFKKLVEDYILEAQRLKEIHEKEKDSLVLESSGDSSATKIKQFINRLRKEDMSYATLNEILAELKECIDKDVYKTLFRTNGGFKIIAENPTISRLLKKEKEHNNDDHDSICHIFDILSNVCLENDESTRELLHPSMFQYLIKFIRSTFPLDVRKSTACLIQLMSQLEDGRKFLLQNGENESIITELLSLLISNDASAMIAVGAINNLALFHGLSEESSNTICKKFVSFITTMMEIFTATEKEKSPEASVLSLVSKSITTITNLARNPKIRNLLAMNDDLWKNSSGLLKSYETRLENDSMRQLVFSLLGLLMNLSLVEKCTDLEICKDINDFCCQLLSCEKANIIERSAGLLNHLMTSCSELVSYNTEMKNYLKFFGIIKGQNEAAKSYIIKCIALCSSQEANMAGDLIEHKAIKSLLELLKSDSSTVIGNAALTVGNFAMDKTFTEKLTSTNVIQDLLKIATNGDNANAVQHNAAIAIGKLARSNQRHLEQLRDLHGLEILHQVLKANQLS